MATLFRKPHATTCFFCNTPVAAPSNPRSFRCPHCACWNRFDASGEILSDEPAMHDEALNARSFARRASPRKDRLPSVYGAGPFCHTCQTNQMLLVNLLSSYLPPPESPEYETRVASLPEYRASLHLRYPPVCPDCQPAVDEEIRKRDNMARARALGGWLNESKGKDRRRQVAEKGKERELSGVQTLVWRVRGCLWVLTLMATLYVHFCVAFSRDVRPLVKLTPLYPLLPVLTLFSIFWTVWDPTYLSYHRSKVKGRAMRVTGKSQFISLQMTAWLSRVITSVGLAVYWYRIAFNGTGLLSASLTRVYFSAMLVLELCVLIASCSVLRLREPAPIRLIDTKTHAPFVAGASREPTPQPGPSTPPRGAPQVPAEPDLLASLSLSAKPVMAAPAPTAVFGMPSFPSAQPTQKERQEEDAMDWTPTDPSAPPPSPSRRGKDDDGSWLKPQRFFPPELPTGLEGLLARTGLVDDTGGGAAMDMDVQPDFARAQQRRTGASAWTWAAGAVVVSLVGVAYALGRRMGPGMLFEDYYGL